MEVLAESQPPVAVGALLVSQWWRKYHPDSGPVHIESAAGLETYLGEEIRKGYPFFILKPLRGVLLRRRRPALVEFRVVRNWIDKYVPRPISAMRTAPAVWGTQGEPTPKRYAVCPAFMELVGAAAVEDACGERYRRDIADKGLGICLFSF